MGNIKRLDMREDIPCSFCGSNASGVWFAKGDRVKEDVFCCRCCATTVLPVLIADSISDNEQSFYRDRDTIKRSFWRAYAFRLLRREK